MKKVICFLRVSTAQQDLEQQREKVVAAILGNGFKKSEIVFVEGKEKFFYIGNGGRRKIWSIGSKGNIIQLQI